VGLARSPRPVPRRHAAARADLLGQAQRRVLGDRRGAQGRPLLPLFLGQSRHTREDDRKSRRVMLIVMDGPAPPPGDRCRNCGTWTQQGDHIAERIDISGRSIDNHGVWIIDRIRSPCRGKFQIRRSLGYPADESGRASVQAIPHFWRLGSCRFGTELHLLCSTKLSGYWYDP